MGDRACWRSALGGVRRVDQELDPIDRGLSVRVGNAVPELQGTLEVGLGLRERIDRFRREAGPDGCVERARMVVRLAPVIGKLGCGRTIGSRFGRVFQRPGEGRMEAFPLVGEQLVVERLPDQGVAEAVAIAMLGNQDLRGQGLPE
jgi:hypothetical protein